MVQHLLQRNQALGLQADVDDDMLVRDLDDGAGNDHLFRGQILRGGGLGGLFAVEVRQRRGKVRCVVVRLIGGIARGMLRRGMSVCVAGGRGDVLLSTSWPASWGRWCVGWVSGDSSCVLRCRFGR